MLMNSNIQLFQSCRGRSSTYFIQQKRSKQICLSRIKLFQHHSKIAQNFLCIYPIALQLSPIYEIIPNGVIRKQIS